MGCYLVALVNVVVNQLEQKPHYIPQYEGGDQIPVDDVSKTAYAPEPQGERKRRLIILVHFTVHIHEDSTCHYCQTCVGHVCRVRPDIVLYTVHQSSLANKSDCTDLSTFQTLLKTNLSRTASDVYFIFLGICISIEII